MTHEEKVRALIRELDQRLSEYARDFTGLSWRGKVLRLVPADANLKDLGKHTDPEAACVGARERIRLYLAAHVGERIAGPEIEIVSGIAQYARRVRELRVQDGYKILSRHTTDPDLGLDLPPDHYVLIDPEPDQTAANRWHIANRIRRDGSLGSQAKVLAYLKSYVGRPVTTEELSYVSKDARQYARRVRELRTEQGYLIATKLTGRPDLAMGEYVLESAERVAEPHDRSIPFEVEKQVYERDENRCRLCGWTRASWSRQDPRILELHHLQDHAAGGHNEPDNLVILCSRCHDDVHAGRRQLPPEILP